MAMPTHLNLSDRTSTPDSSASSLRPPSTSRGLSTSHQLRASADMSTLAAPLSARNPRPRSEIFFSSPLPSAADEALDHAAQQWLADIDQYETTLEEMAAATLDRGFKGELGSIEQWFRMLSEAERTAALYSLLQQTTQVQIRFFIQVLQQMSRSNPVSSILSPANFGENDPMSARLNEAMSQLHVDNSRNSTIGRSPLSPAPGAAAPGSALNPSTTPGLTSVANPSASQPSKPRNPGLDSSTISAMFPDAAAAIAKKKAEFSQQQAAQSPPPNRTSSAFERNPLIAPAISAPPGTMDSQPPASPWRRTPDSQGQGQTRSGSQPQPQQQPPIARPKSSSSQPLPQQQQSGQQQMGQFTQPPPSAGLRSPLNENIRNTTITVPDLAAQTASLLSPYAVGASWASMTNTPVMPSFNQPSASQGEGQSQLLSPAGPSQVDMVANATAMKLAALSTVNGRFALDDARKYRRARSNDASSPGLGSGSSSSGSSSHHHHRHQTNNMNESNNSNLNLIQQQQQQAAQHQLQHAQQQQQQQQQTLSPSMASHSSLTGPNVIMVNNADQFLDAQQLAALQAQQQQAAASGLSQHRSRPTSPGIAMHLHNSHPYQQHHLHHAASATGLSSQTSSSPLPSPFAPPQNNGFLAAYDMQHWLGPGGALNPHGASGSHTPSLLGDPNVGGGYLSDHSELARGRSPRGRRGTSKPPEDPADPMLLRDVPGWLRSLRLHKYTENLRDLSWRELVELDDKGLEARGVNAMGARNKMLKVFEQVKEAQKAGKLDAIL